MTPIQLFANKHTVNEIRLGGEISGVLRRAPFQFDPIHKHVYKAHPNDVGFCCLFCLFVFLVSIAIFILI